MSDEEFDDDADLDEAELADDDIDEDALDDDLDDDLALDDDLVVDADDLADDPLAVIPLVGGDLAIPEVVADGAVGETAATDEDDEEGLELEEELHPDDVETPLDALLQERTASVTIDDEEEDLEEEEPDLDDRGEGPTKIVPRRPGEFLCSSCFLVLPRNQLADEAKMLCRDCA
jgi:uncharacterized protein DUF4193